MASSVRNLAHFALGFITSGIYVSGILLAGFLYYDHLLNQSSVDSVTVIILLPFIGLGVICLIPLLVVVFLYCPKFLKRGALIPCVLAIGIVAYGLSEKVVKPHFTDDAAYRSCVSSFNHRQGIKDCTALISKLEQTGEIKLKDIENTKGDYWLAEALSYRGRHYIRNDQFELGKQDFAAAFLLPEGAAVVAGNLAEAGFIRQDLFEADFERELAVLKQLLVQENVTRIDNGSNFLKAQFISVVDFCRLSTGRSQDNCQALIEKQVFEN